MEMGLGDIRYRISDIRYRMISDTRYQRLGYRSGEKAVGIDTPKTSFWRVFGCGFAAELFDELTIFLTA
jgi:hypothetical protein